MFHCLDLLSQLESCEKEKKKKELIVLHSLLIPLNFALSEKRKLNTLWIFVFEKQKKKLTKEKEKKNSRFCKCLFMITIKKTVFWTPSVPLASSPPLTVIPWLASLVMLQNRTSHSPFCRATPCHRQTRSGFSLLIGNLRSSWFQFGFEQEPPLERISLLVWRSSRASEKHWWPDQTQTENYRDDKKGKRKE